jgi:hypothetical protein
MVVAAAAARRQGPTRSPSLARIRRALLRIPRPRHSRCSEAETTTTDLPLKEQLFGVRGPMGAVGRLRGVPSPDVAVAYVNAASGAGSLVADAGYCSVAGIEYVLQHDTSKISENHSKASGRYRHSVTSKKSASSNCVVGPA